MRWAPALLVCLLLPGCTLPEGDPVVDCERPSWIEGKNTAIVQNSWPRTGIRSSPEKQEDLGAGSLQFLDYPLDRIEMDFHWREDDDRASYRGVLANQGTLRVTFWDPDGNPLQARFNGTGPARHEWTWTNEQEANFTFTIQLAPDDEEPEPHSVQVRWRFDGAPRDPQAPADIALAWYEARYWYRSCTP